MLRRASEHMELVLELMRRTSPVPLSKKMDLT